MKGFLLELKDGIDMDAAKSELENLLGQGRVEFKNGVTGILATDIMVKEGPMDEVNIYQVDIHFPKVGTSKVDPIGEEFIRSSAQFSPLIPGMGDSVLSKQRVGNFTDSLYSILSKGYRVGNLLKHGYEYEKSKLV